MTTGYAGSEATAEARRNAGGSVADILRLLSGGATEAILLALGDGPMQTKVLTHRVRGYTARTIYRYLPKLAQLGLVEREDEPGGPAKVVNTLTAGPGRGMCTVIERFARASMTRLPSDQVELGTWGSLGLLADLWEAGVVDALSRDSRSPTELVQLQRGLSYHQVNRKVRQFKEAGFLLESQRGAKRQRSYAMAEKGARTMALVAGIGQWRARHLVSAAEGLAVGELATVMRASLPLAAIEGHAGNGLRLRVVGRRSEETVPVTVRDDGRVHPTEGDPARFPTELAGDTAAWLSALVDGELNLEFAGDPLLARDCLASLYDRLWTPSPF